MVKTAENLGDYSSDPKPKSIWRALGRAFWGPQRFLGRRGRNPFGRSWGTKLALLLTVAAILSGFATYGALTATPPFGNDPTTVIWLLNLDLVILLLLVILIARRIAKIWSGRRKGIAGSRLHVRLVLIFSIMAAAPAILMAIFSAFFFHFGVQSWFSERVRTAVVESQAVAEAYLEEHKQVIRADILAMANDIDRQSAMLIDNQEAFDRVIDTQSLLRNLSEAMIFDGRGRILARSGLTFTLTFENLPPYLMDRAEDGEVVIMTGGQNEDRVRALVKLNNFADSYLFVGRMIDPVVLSHLDATRTAAEEYAQLEGKYSGLQITVTMIFVVVALLLLLAATWFGIVLARQLVSPISKLISVSERVRAGDLTARIAESEQIEEFDFLARSFNRMTAQIGQQRDELVMANRQLDQRRRFTETVLAGVSAGVIGVDESGRVTLVNNVASELFEKPSTDLVGQSIGDILPEIESLLVQAHDRPNKVTQAEIPLTRQDKSRLTLLVRIAIELIGDEDKGAVLTFDDITELQSAQRKAAWADVARRIAHEIKNPLTPIQLSAERLKRKYLKEIETDPETFSKCTDTIIKHVGDIGHMVNEFSSFARMPEPEFHYENLCPHIQDMIILQKEAHPDIDFSVRGVCQSGQKLMVECDSQQIRQAMTNLIQNAIDSIHARQRKETIRGKVDVVLTILEAEDECAVIITDNGLGLPEETDPSTLSEPYVTHREKGTGLGLAIVKKIMEDHKGRLVIGTTEWIRKQKDWRNLDGAAISLVLPLQKHAPGQEDLSHG